MFRTNKQKAKEILSNVPEDKVFWTNDGRELRNLHELSSALAGMENNTFRCHVNKEKNDFKSWIGDVIEDKKLASSIEKTKVKKVLLRKLDKRIDQLGSLTK